MSLLQISLKTLKQMKYSIGFFVSEIGGGKQYLLKLILFKAWIDLVQDLVMIFHILKLSLDTEI